MAFHQPTRQAVQRAIQPANEQRDDVPRPPQQPSQQSPDELQAWVLFAPPDTAASSSYLSEQSLDTPGRSRASDFGSLDTNARLGVNAQPHPFAGPAVAAEDESVEDDGELDSLDSHLPEFLANPSPFRDSSAVNFHSTPVLPAHDGLGSFRIGRPAAGANVQEQLYAFERYNPRRIQQEGTSSHFPELGIDHEALQEAEKAQRIEAWRLEHSRLLLEEVQKETRRRRLSHASTTQVQTTGTAGEIQLASTTTANIAGSDTEQMDWHDEATEEAAPESQGFLSRITRKVIKELIDIDDHLLSILFGESLPEVEDLSRTPRASHLDGALATDGDSSWHLRLLERVARELGLLVNRLSHHPGAFSTYARMQQMSLPYAGLPVIPEAAIATTAPSENESLSPTAPEFRPTIAQHSQPIEIPGARPMASHSQGDTQMDAVREDGACAPSGTAGFSQEEWEQDLDIKLVFKYLKSRFSSRPPSNPATAGGSHIASSSTHDIAAKAARVRQHHPLVSSRPRTAERRAFKVTSPSSPVALRHASSCASQSTRRSARRSSCSSRHYWDIGGSLGTGSVIASNGPMGSWGEV